MSEKQYGYGEYRFDRFEGRVRMAEGALTKAHNLDQALGKVQKRYAHSPWRSHCRFELTSFRALKEQDNG